MLTPDQIQALRNRDFPGPALYSAGFTPQLRIAYKPPWYEIHDPGGYVTATASLEVLHELLVLEASGLGRVRELVHGEIPELWQESWTCPEIHPKPSGGLSVEDLDLDLDL